MALKNKAITVTYVAWDTSANAGKISDSANHTLKLIQDGTAAAPTNSPSEVDSTNCPGLYKLALTASDMNFNCVALAGKSSTSNVSIIPVVIVTEQGNLDAKVSDVKAKTDNLPASFPSNFASLAITAGGAVTAGTVSDKTGYGLASDGLDQVTVETDLNARQSLSIIAAACAGTGGATSNAYKGAGVATTRITFTAASGERSAVTLAPPA